MIRDTLTQIVTTLAATAGTALLGWFALTARRLLAQRFYVAQVTVLERRARAVAAESQGSVDALKDPARPGEWTPVMAARVRAEAINRVRALEPLACQTVLEALDGDAQKLDALIGTYIEETVRTMRLWDVPAPVDARVLPRLDVPAPIAPASAADER